MASLVAICEGCGVRFRTSHPELARKKNCPRCQAPLDSAIDRALAGETPRSDSAEIPVAEPPAPDPTPEPAEALPAAGLRRNTWIQWISTSALLLAAVAAIQFWLLPASSHRTPPRLAVMNQPAWVPPPPPKPEPPPPAPQPELAPHVVPPAPHGVEADERPSRTLPPPPPVPAHVEDPETMPLRPLVSLEPSIPRPFAPGGQAQSPRAQRSQAPPAPQAGRLELPPPPEPPAPAPGEEPRRIVVRDDSGKPAVTRVYGEHQGKLAVLLPDGQLGWVEGRSFTDEPFRPLSSDELLQTLQEGPYRDFQVKQTPHYIVFYRCTEGFATASANLLESLYAGLLQKFKDWKLQVHESEFPLVAVIFDTEKAFRAENHVPKDVQAYFHILNNRIFFYETSDREQNSPEVAAIRKPQTIAHEGAHQILLNIGVQARLARWPLWLVEGLAEYCAPTYTKRGAEWAGVGKVNPLHMATIQDLKDQGELQRFRGMPRAQIAGIALERLIGQSELTPTDYASAWALTHFLASKRLEDFRDYLKSMSQMPPLESVSAEDHVSTFRETFGDLPKLDKALRKHLSSLKYEPLPYYAVMFEQPMPGGALRKAALVSQSPSMIRQWIDTVQSPRGIPGSWQAYPCPSRTQAMFVAEQWMNPH